MSDEELVFVLTAYDAEVMYAPEEDDPSKATLRKVMADSFRARTMLRDYLRSKNLA